MSSKLVLDREKSSATVQSAGTEYEDKIAESMVAIYGPEAEGAVRTLVRLLVSKLRGDTQAMVGADQAHLNEVADDAQVLANRDDRGKSLYSRLVDLRESAENVFGPTFARELGFKGSTPQDPVAALGLGRQVLENIKSDEVTVPAPVKIGISMDLGAWEAPLDGDLSALDEAVQAVRREKREADQTLVDKQRAMASYDQTFSTTANLLSDLLKAAGETELAGRVRPSTRKPGQTIEDAGTEATNTPPTA